MKIMKTIKVIDLLNIISKGEEEVPKKIKYRNKSYIKRSDCYWYILENGTFNDELFVTINCLNDEVEIIEDNKIEKLENKIDTTFENATYSERMRLTEIINKINEIIDIINGDSDE